MITSLITHYVGNALLQHPLKLSEVCWDLPQASKELLEEKILLQFKSLEEFEFKHEVSLQHHTLYQEVKKIFAAKETFVTSSQEIASRLYHLASNPRTPDGHLLIAKIEKDPETEADYDKLLILKLESMGFYLKSEQDDEQVELHLSEGFIVDKIDKGCLVYNTNEDNGYVAHVFDRKKGADAAYWFDNFLNVAPRANEFFHTNETLALYKSYISKQLPAEFEVSKADQAEFLNRTMDFFSEKDHFDFNEFTESVLEDKELIESFVNYKTDHEHQTQVSISEDFNIDPLAVKKNQRFFKSVIKLDKNFHIYVHGDRKRIETGQDEKGKYYRLYFDEEK